MTQSKETPMPKLGLSDEDRNGVIGILSKVADHESTIRNLRKDVNVCFDKYHDIGTQDFLTGLIEDHEKMAWMLRATLQTK